MENPQPASNPPHSSSTHVPSAPDIQTSFLSPQYYETAGGRSTRQIIDSASYSTTPSSSPPNELSHVFSAQDSHRAEPSVAALADADRAILEKAAQSMRRNSSGENYLQAQQLAEEEARKKSADEGRREPVAEGPGKAQNEHDHTRHAIIPPYMLKSIAASEKAGPQARESARQTLASGTGGRDARRSSHER